MTATKTPRKAVAPARERLNTNGLSPAGFPLFTYVIRDIEPTPLWFKDDAAAKAWMRSHRAGSPRIVHAEYADRAVQIDAGTYTPGQPVRAKTAGKGRPSGHGFNPKDVREWATANGYTVGARGRMPAEVFAAYGDAHARSGFAA